MKKSVIFIVEGSTDKDALENILKKIYKGNKEIVFIITSGDITTNSCTTLDNICEKIYEFVLNKMKEYKLKKPNFCSQLTLYFIPYKYFSFYPTDLKASSAVA